MFTNTKVIAELTKTRLALTQFETNTRMSDLKTRRQLDSLKDQLDELLVQKEPELPELDFPTWAHGKAWGSIKYTQNLAPADHGQVIALPYKVTRRMGGQIILHNIGYVATMHPMKGEGIRVTTLTRAGTAATYEVADLTDRFPAYYCVTRI